MFKSEVYGGFKVLEFFKKNEEIEKKVYIPVNKSINTLQRVFLRNKNNLYLIEFLDREIENLSFSNLDDLYEYLCNNSVPKADFTAMIYDSLDILYFFKEKESDEEYIYVHKGFDTDVIKRATIWKDGGKCVVEYTTSEVYIFDDVSEIEEHLRIGASI